jgi:hypothetical protein
MEVNGFCKKGDPGFSKRPCLIESSTYPDNGSTPMEGRIWRTRWGLADLRFVTERDLRQPVESGCSIRRPRRIHGRTLS